MLSGQPNSGYGIHPLHSTVNHKEGEPDGELFLSIHIRLSSKDSLGLNFELVLNTSSFIIHKLEVILTEFVTPIMTALRGKHKLELHESVMCWDCK